MRARLRRVRAGEWLAAVAGGALFATPWLPWYGGDSGVRCITAPCPSLVAFTGWEGLVAHDVALVVVGAVGLLVVVAVLVVRARPALAVIESAALLLGLVTAALATYLWARGPADASPGEALFFFPLIGASLAPLAAFGIAAGAWWSLRVRASAGPSAKRAADLGRVCVPIGAGILIVSLFLPWFDAASVGGPSGGFTTYSPLSPIDPPRGRVTGFEAFLVSDVLLVLIALFAAGGALAALRRDRFGLDVVAVLAAGLVLAGLLVSVTRPAQILLGSAGDGFSREYGVLVALAGATLALLGGTWASLRRTSAVGGGP